MTFLEVSYPITSGKIDSIRDDKIYGEQFDHFVLM